MQASVDWCERNYATNTQVAEYWNTLSSVPLVFLGIAGAALSYRHALRNSRFQYGFGGLSLVGFGSTMFHSTLLYRWQLMDEIPMLLLNHVFIYCLIHNDPAKDRVWPVTVSILTFSAFAEIFMYVYLKWYWVFVVAWGGGVAFMYYLCYPLMATMSRPAWRLMKLSMVTILIGMILWIAEHVFCAYVEPIQFHAWWHLFAGYGTYCWLLTLMATRAEAELKRPSIHNLACAPLYIVVDDGVGKDE
jgi:dihydroceramidase